MNKLLEYGRKAMFLVRVLSGHEERRIRAYRLQLQQRMEKAQAKKAELKRVPEQVILSEVRRMVEEMQALNRKLEETEAAIEDYLKPIDKNAHTIMNMQIDKEQQQMKEMIKAMQEQAMHNKEIAERQVELESIEAQKQAEPDSVDQSPQIQNMVSRQKQEQAN
ncbi:uncharacterized protein A4U43_C10F18280 [Asparagus officinalis]|uniref:Uncharacterized protein n=1 Tax=Asparagus officinalis TaxID=4686 RepID=A0A5P1E5K4_ASPOF|nr:uncharacterized protein LOC109826025 [Asparagus officinalis]ONK57263.1 uncharacterized protein A4U43_C10F18280 [Asparagus officinalis]